MLQSNPVRWNQEKWETHLNEPTLEKHSEKLFHNFVWIIGNSSR